MKLSMKAAFGFTLFSLSAFYLGYGVWTLEILTGSGRPGPGFFPLIVGGLLTLMTGYDMLKDLKEQGLAVNASSCTVDDENAPDDISVGAPVTYTRDAAILLALIAGFILILKIVGAILAMILFMLALLQVFNPGKHLQNVLFSVIFPLCVYGLFELWLRAGLPPGLMGN
ncbi:tripartite tricarboxylate transporter TctB family protein [Cobetia amphilecti]|uniref:tripartite tricarboxylate transporter TctB family protein n=1 Tax=Cobetia amphilecti TaxID=1055104 RepID=UPI0025501121|nr:tripartite tricarboxylate transporter TctB family protein [Cobetia amphilecti]